MRALVLAAALVAGCVSSPAPDTHRHYVAALSGHQQPTDTGSAATGAATFDVDTATQTVSAHIEIHGLRMAALSQHLSHMPMGPMHLHRYQGDDVSLILPFPMGATYAETADGFTVSLRDAPYAASAALVHSDLSFERFLAALDHDPVFLNLHTERFGDGEISGRLQARD